MLTHSRDILLTPIEYLKGVGPQKAELLKKELNLHTFGDMMQLYPFRYIDRSSFVKVRDIKAEGMPVQMIGHISRVEYTGGPRGRLVADFRDETGVVELVWFQGTSTLEKILATGGNFLVFGKVVWFNNGWSITHPELESIENSGPENFTGYQPVYTSTEKLRTRWLGGRNYVKLVQQLMSQIQPKDLPEILPEAIVKSFQLVGRAFALKNIHFPDNEQSLQKSIHRLKFEELFLHQIGICKLKLNHRKVKGFRFEKVGDHFNTFYKEYLPFELTGDQKKVLKEIRQDTQTGAQMNRLLQGDVGSGKTIVALLCMLLALDNGFQACLMAPTEILALQHFATISRLLEKMNIPVGFLSGKTKAKERKELLKQLQSGELKVIIGTHALIEDKVMFQNLGLSIIDEQHRFGVAQRAKLWDKNILPPHILVMTATPIPRTLAMTSYGDLEVSVIKELPPGRKPITTVHRTESYRARVMDFLKQEISIGRQVYIVYPLIEESEKMDYENLYAGFEQVKQFFPEPQYQISMVHGRQSQEERDGNMSGFVKGVSQIMVATTVIEVGVDVPNASVMLIESAERFGLSQLHQLRGRVGRGADQSYCILLTGVKLGNIGKERIRTMVNESSGFAISEKDLELRGPGEIEGIRQSGAADLKIADIVKDVELMSITRNAAIQILQQDPFLDGIEYVNLKTWLMNRNNRDIWSRIS